MEIVNLLLDHIYFKDLGSRPEYSPNEGCFKFPSGSKLYIGGCSDSKELNKNRGTEADIIVMDEFGFFEYKPKYLLESVLYPQLQTTKGQMIITSTPPEDLTHYYVEQVHLARTRGFLFEWTIDDSINSWMDEETHQMIIESCGVEGIESEAYKREYKCMFIAPKNRLVIPEAGKANIEVGSIKRPQKSLYYCQWDLGLVDYTFAIWGFYDFKQAKLFIEEEMMENYTTTPKLVEKARIIEQGLHIQPEDGWVQEFKRFSDNDAQQIMDMNAPIEQGGLGYSIMPIVKRSSDKGVSFLESCINNLRVAIGSERIQISKKCVNLLTQVRFGLWNAQRTDFVRTEVLGHLDGLMALAYLWKNIEFDKNPYPPDPKNLEKFAYPPDYDVNFNRTQKEIKKLFEKQSFPSYY